MRRLPLYNGPSVTPLEAETPLPRDPECQACKLHEGSGSVCIGAEGIPSNQGPNPTQNALILGGAPTLTEGRANRPFMSKAGEVLRQQLSRYREMAFVLDHAVKCAPGATKVTPTMIKACRRYVAQTRLVARPDRIICMGSQAITAVMGKGLATFSARKSYAFLADGTPVFFLVDPSAATRNRFVRGWFNEDLHWALTTDLSQLARPPYNGEALFIETVEDAEDAAFELATAQVLTVDVESFGAPHDPEHKLLTLGISPDGADYAYVLEYDACQDPNLLMPFVRLLCDPNAPPTRQVGGQNFKFDCNHVRWAKANTLRTPVQRVAFDTKLMRKLGCADSLADLELMQAFIGMWGSKDSVDHYVTQGGAELRKMGKNPDYRVPFGNIPREDLETAIERVAEGIDAERYAYGFIPGDIRGVYCALDCVSTGKLRPLVIRGMEQEGTDRVWTEVTQDLNDAITEMEWVGLKVSVPAMVKLQRTMQERIDAAELELQQFAQMMDSGEFNPGSTKDVAELLHGKLKLPVLRTTPGGKPSTDAGTLQLLADKGFKEARTIIDYRTAVKFKGTYADALLLQTRADGRIHANFNLDGTVSGRPSSNEPNMLNIPARGEFAKQCREIFVAADGNILLDADYSQIELRVAAFLSQDPLMMELYNIPGTDFHLETARLIAPIFGVDPALVTADHRLRGEAKTVNFAVLYGDTPAGLAAKLGCTKKHAQSLFDAILGKFRKLKAWIAAQLTFARREGKCYTSWGGANFRMRPLWQIADQGPEAETAERASWNTPVQGSAADFTNRSVGLIYRWLRDNDVPAKLVLTVYDSILVESREDVACDVAHKMREIMEGHPGYGVPILTDLKVGYSWGTLHKAPHAQLPKTGPIPAMILAN